MGLSDLHIHTIHSFDGTSSVSAILKHVAARTNLDVIAITDHNTMSGVSEALDLAPAYGIEVIPGCEISTSEGHLLGLFIRRPVEAGLTLIETIQQIGDQGGICIAPHPMAKGAPSLQFNTIQQALRQPGLAQILVGVEAFNGGLVYTRRNPIVEAISLSLPLAQVGNSDAHVMQTIGLGASEFAGHTAQDLRLALETHSTHVHKGEGLDGFGVLLEYLPRYFLRKMGWVAFNASPEEPIKFTRFNYALEH